MHCRALFSLPKQGLTFIEGQGSTCCTNNMKSNLHAGPAPLSPSRSYPGCINITSGYDVLRMRFGVGMNKDHTLEEVGRQFSRPRR
jgi:hypothetical protein